LGIPVETEVEKIIRFPEIKKKIEEASAVLKEEIKEIRAEELETLVLKKYLKEIEDLFSGEVIEKEFKREGVKEKRINYSYSKKFDIKETIKSFIKGENKFYSKLTKDKKKANIVLLLDFSSSMKGKKIEDLKKFVTYLFVFERKKIKKFYLFNKDVKEANDLKEVLMEAPRYNTNIGKALEEINKKERDSIVYLVTDNIPTVGKESKIIEEIEKLKIKNNKLFVILLNPKKESVSLAQKMSDKILVLENNYLLGLIEALNKIE